MAVNERFRPFELHLAKEEAEEEQVRQQEGTEIEIKEKRKRNEYRGMGEEVKNGGNLYKKLIRERKSREKEREKYYHTFS